MPTNDDKTGLDESAILNFLDTDVMPQGQTEVIEEVEGNKNEGEGEDDNKSEPKMEQKVSSQIEKEELKEQTPEEDEQDSIAYQIFQGMQTSLGIEFSEEELSSIELSDDLDTVNKLILLGTEKKTEAAFNTFFDENPDIREAISYKQAYGSLEGFGRNTDSTDFIDYAKVDLSNESNQEEIYRRALSLKGLAKEDIDELIEVAKDKYTLETKAKDSKTALIASEAEKKSKYDEEIQHRIREKQESDNALVREITSLIDGGKILGITLDAKMQREFKDYFSKPIDASGRTAKEIADEDLNIEQELLFEYWKMSKFKGMANTEAKKIKTLAELVKKGQDGRPSVAFGSKALNQTQSNKSNFDVDSLSDFINS